MIIAIWTTEDNPVLVRRAVRRRCERIVADLNVPVPFDITKLFATIRSRTGKHIRIEYMDLPQDGPCGLWVSLEDVDVLLVTSRTSPAHQVHIALHEMGHVLAGHHAAPVLDEGASRLLLPDLDPALVQRMLGRTNYDEGAEEEAELIASLIGRYATDWTPSPAAAAVPEEATAVVNRINKALGVADRSRTSL